jgi:hypothetical protein
MPLPPHRVKSRSSIALGALAMLLTASTAGHGQVPLPPPRPLDLGVPGSAETPGAPTPEDAAPGSGPPPPSACQARLAGEGAVAQILPPLVGPGECGAPDVVRLDAVVLPDGQHVAMTPAPTLRCTMAEAIVEWVRADVAPAAALLGSPLRGIETYDSYDCRGRNRIVGAKLSEHGKANALDMRSVKLANGHSFELTDAGVLREFRDDLRRSACARFMTVLGPGSDGYHESHIHVDLAERHNGYRLCQWDVRVPQEKPADDTVAAGAEVPLPRPRPAAVAAQDEAGFDDRGAAPQECGRTHEGRRHGCAQQSRRP